MGRRNYYAAVVARMAARIVVVVVATGAPGPVVARVVLLIVYLVLHDLTGGQTKTSSGTRSPPWGAVVGMRTLLQPSPGWYFENRTVF